jgi:hypothetical protein
MMLLQAPSGYRDVFLGSMGLCLRGPRVEDVGGAEPGAERR